MPTLADSPHPSAYGPIVGEAVGVPFLAVPPPDPDPSAPVVVAWHLLDPPRSEVAFAAAVPLAGLDAWRVYLGLPLTGSRLPPGGFEELAAQAAADAVLGLYKPIVYGAAEEFPAVFSSLRDQLRLGPSRVGLMGGSIGAAVAQLLMSESSVEVAAAVLISPLVHLAGVVESMATRYGMTYPWADDSRAVAERLDFLARVDQLWGAGAAVRIVVGAEDGPEFRDPAKSLLCALLARGAEADLHEVPGMAHALADEPGVAPAFQQAHATAVDRLAVDWFDRHLTR